MSRHIPALGRSESAIHRRLGTDSDCRRSWAVRHRPSRKWEIEALEDRVVPATITVTNLGDSGIGTLRAAIEQANVDSTPDTISFAPAVTGEINLMTALPDLSADITIAGPGPTVLTVARSAAAGSPEFRVLTVPSGAEVAVSGLTIAGGQVSNTYGGGISNAGTLALTDLDLSGNSAGSFGGGGIANSGALSIADCTLSGNSSWNPNGISGIEGYAGAIINQPDSTMSVAQCTISGNSAFAAGGIYNGGTMTITDSTISSNNSAKGSGAMFNAGAMTLTDSDLAGNSTEFGSGGAITNAEGTGPSGPPSLAITDCSFRGNSAGSDGGAITNLGAATIGGCSFSGNSAGFYGGAIATGNVSPASSLTVTNSTFSGNSAAGWGGALYNVSDGTLTVTNSTLTNNTSGATGIIDGDAGGGIANAGGPVTIEDSTISGNLARGGLGGGIAIGSYDLGFPTSFLLINTIVAGNTSTETTPFSDVLGVVQATSTHNLIGDGTGVTGISNGTNGNPIGPSSDPP